MSRELKDALDDATALHISDVMELLKQDPLATLNDIHYSQTEGYLHQLMNKEGSLLKGLIIALENHLEK